MARREKTNSGFSPAFLGRLCAGPARYSSSPRYVAPGRVDDMALPRQYKGYRRGCMFFTLTLLDPHSHMWGQNTLIISSLSPERDWGPKRVKPFFLPVDIQHNQWPCRFLFLLIEEMQVLWSQSGYIYIYLYLYLYLYINIYNMLYLP